MQKVQAYLKMIISTQSFQFPHVNKKTPYHWEDCQTDGDWDLWLGWNNSPDNHLHDVIHF